jgi:hypothetical protein
MQKNGSFKAKRAIEQPTIHVTLAIIYSALLITITGIILLFLLL